jgi:peptide deformylase
MALLEVLKYPDPRLAKRADEVIGVDGGVDGEIKKLVSDMVDTMYFEKGVGLAATQVGSDKRVIVLDVPEARRQERHGDITEDKGHKKGGNLIVLVNPVLVEASGELKYEEGCLSVPGVTSEVKRASSLVVRGLDLEGIELEIRAEGLLAVAIQHEMDHIDGKLFIDRLSRIKRDIIKRKLKKSVGAL